MDFILLFYAGVKFEVPCKVKQALFIARVRLLDKIMLLLPVTNQVLGCLPTKGVNDAFNKVSSELFQECSRLFPEMPSIISDTKYSFMN